MLHMLHRQYRLHGILISVKFLVCRSLDPNIIVWSRILVKNHENESSLRLFHIGNL